MQKQHIIILLLIILIQAAYTKNLTRPCDVTPGKDMTFCNEKLSYEDRVKELISELTIDEKLGLFVNSADPVARLNISAYQWWSEALHGVADSPGVNFLGVIKHATSFPNVIGLGATFNRTLWGQIGNTISTEARAMQNQGQATFTFWAPNINIYRDPRWGRGQETPGEDPYLTSEYALYFVDNMQQGEDDQHLKVSSCCKHYYAYNIENWKDSNGKTYIRYTFDAQVDKRDIADTFLPAFQSCIQRAKASAIMCSYNAVNGVPTCANPDILTNLARKVWKFDGYITGDCGAVKNVETGHHYTKNKTDTNKVTLQSGVDQDCGDFLTKELLYQSLKISAISINDINTALYNQFMVLFRMGLFDSAEYQPYLKYTPDMVNTQQSQQLAVEAAQQSMVLLKNDNKYLPLKINNSTTMKIGMIGPNAKATNTMQGDYGGQAPFFISPIEGFTQKGYQISFALGCENVQCNKPDLIPEAIDLADNLDLAIVVLGIDNTQEREMKDRQTLELPGFQQTLCDVISQVAKKTIVVIMGGGAIDITSLKNNNKISAIIWMGYPSQAGGTALSDIILGNFNPSGRNPITWYPQSLNSINMTIENMRPNNQTNYPGQSVYEFGYGLSYSNFTYKLKDSKRRVFGLNYIKYQGAQADSDQNYLRTPIDTSKLIKEKFTITVTNNGPYDGSESILVFIQSPNFGQNGLPIKSLVSFEKVFIKNGDSQDVQFEILPLDVTYFDLDGKRQTIEGTWNALVGVPSQLSVPIYVSPQADKEKNFLVLE